MSKGTDGKRKHPSRREFIGTAVAAGAATACIGPAALSARSGKGAVQTGRANQDQVVSNVDDALAVARTEASMPGAFPGKVVQIRKPGAVVGSRPDAQIAAAMLAAGMRELTGSSDSTEAWSRFFAPEDRIGIKVNPLAGRLLCNSHELIDAVIENLEAVGVPRSNIVIWDRRQEDLIETGFTSERYPGIECIGTEYKVVENGEEIWRGEDRLDKSVYYEFDIEGRYSDELLPLMIHGGTRSYFTKIITQQIDKVINVPVLKNWDQSVTLSMKNMAYGVTSNTARGHRIWHRFIAEVCAFPAIRDKVVLNIIDGLRGCYAGGPSPAARFVWNADTIWVATDGVAADAIASDTIFAKQGEMGIARLPSAENRDRRLEQLVRAQRFGLGVYDKDRIDLRSVDLA